MSPNLVTLLIISKLFTRTKQNWPQQDGISCFWCYNMYVCYIYVIFPSPNSYNINSEVNVFHPCGLYIMHTYTCMCLQFTVCFTFIKWSHCMHINKMLKEMCLKHFIWNFLLTLHIVNTILLLVSLFIVDTVEIWFSKGIADYI